MLFLLTAFYLSKAIAKIRILFELSGNKIQYRDNLLLFRLKCGRYFTVYSGMLVICPCSL